MLDVVSQCKLNGLLSIFELLRMVICRSTDNQTKIRSGDGSCDILASRRHEVRGDE